MSEEEQCFFVISGGWNLYSNIVYGKNNIVKNFGEIIKIGVIGKKVPEDVVLPFNMMDISDEPDKLNEIILEKTGSRANLTTTVCSLT
ncbi:MAG: hypothetical protein GY749_30290 [Desulfobacteraceae bacterium]|nr:hypothetical protein [Desulfobacteraceae bacterium]